MKISPVLGAKSDTDFSKQIARTEELTSYVTKLI
jgi:hypothetical protein